MNQLIIWIDELNFQSGNPPTFSLYKEEDVDLTLAERDDKLTTAMEKSGLSLTRTYYKKNYSLDDEDIEDAGTAQTTSQFSASDTTTADAISPLDSMANRMNKEASAAMTGMWAPIEAMINEAQSLEELRDKLVEAYKDMDVNALGTLMEQAFAVAELAGRFTVKQ
jgi:phage gp29-like protein